jgi:hypothetical protein
MGIVPASMLSATQMYASARIAVEIIDEPEELATKPEGIVDLGIIEWLLRPSLLLEDNLFEPLKSGPWQNLPSDIVQEPAKSVCRIDICLDGYRPTHIGTGFVVGEDKNGQLIVMTNAHVIDGAIQYGWLNSSGLKLACDFARYTTMAEGQLFPLLDKYQIHPYYDLALIYLPKEYFKSSQASPNPLIVAETSPNPVLDLQIGVVGHPSFDSSRDPFPKYFGFGEEFGVKRFSPGYIRNLENRSWRNHDVDLFLHDATTLSGSSGSCILDLVNMKVVGLHFGGWPMQKQILEVGGKDMLAQLFHANGAVPLWTLRNDPLLREIYFE